MTPLLPLLMRRFSLAPQGGQLEQRKTLSHRVAAETCWLLCWLYKRRPRPARNRQGILQKCPLFCEDEMKVRRMKAESKNESGPALIIRSVTGQRSKSCSANQGIPVDLIPRTSLETVIGFL